MKLVHNTLLSLSGFFFAIFLNVPLLSMDRPDYSNEERKSFDPREVEAYLAPHFFEKERDPREIMLRADRELYQKYERLLQLLKTTGYVWNKGLHFQTLKRSPRERETLRSWGFTEHDIDELTIRDIHDPLNDERIRRAHRPELGHPVYPYTFRLFASRLLWPHTPSEADLLLLIPFLRRIDPRNGDVDISIDQCTLFEMAVNHNYARVVQLLLDDKHVSIRGSEEHNLFEHALQRGKYDIAQLILRKKPSVTISDSVRGKIRGDERAAGLVRIADHQGFVSDIQIASGGPDIIPVNVPTPDALIKKYAKKHADLIRAAEKNNAVYPSQPPHSTRINPLYAWTLGIPVIAAVAKGIHEIYSKYYHGEKKDSQAKKVA